MTMRWVFHDPNDTDPATATWVMPRNPREMTSPSIQRTVSTSGALGGKIIAYEGAPVGRPWTFKGRMLNRAMYDTLTFWQGKQNRFTITDHFGRVLTIVPTTFDFTPKGTRHNYWDGEYEFNAIVIGIAAPTVPDIWS